MAAFALAGAAAAQTTSSFEPQWIDGLGVPQGLYPDEDLDARRKGEVSLCCPVDNHGRLACQVISQAPRRGAFGEAAVHASEWPELTTDSARALHSLGRDIALQVRFDVVEGTPELDVSRGFSVLTRHFTPRIEVAYEGLCTAPAPAQPRRLLERPGIRTP